MPTPPDRGCCEQLQQEWGAGVGNLIADDVGEHIQQLRGCRNRPDVGRCEQTVHEMLENFSAYLDNETPGVGSEYCPGQDPQKIQSLWCASAWSMLQGQ